MSKRTENVGEFSNSKSKRQKPSEINPNEIDVVNVQNQDSLPPILKLNAICCDDLFDWLSLEDLHSLGQTCKRMHRLTGLYFQENFKETLIYENQDIYHTNNYLSKSIRLNKFMQFARCVLLRSNSDLQYFAANCDSVRSIDFAVKEGTFTEAMIDCIKLKLDKIEVIKFSGSRKPYKLNFYENFLKLCPNLKTLCVHFTPFDNEWMCYKYPKLEHLKFMSPNEALSNDLRQFFQQNTQLQTLETDAEHLFKISDSIINFKIKLNVLNIYYCHHFRNLNHICPLINKLYENGVYKRLEFKVFGTNIPQAQMNQIATLRGFEHLTGFLFGFFSKMSVFPTISSIRELCIRDQWIDLKNLENMTVSFPNLREVHFSYGSTDKVLPFIRRLPNLKVLSINYLKNRENSDIMLDLSSLNKERKKLVGACKVTIYVNEVVYLKLKMVTKNLYANYNLIEIKRIESFETRLM